jgi:glycosyltransferase involved in cell wall biosynthesis
VIVNLRYPSAGEMSSTLIQALGAGKPVVITALSNLQEIPHDAVTRVRPDHEKEDLKEALSMLFRNEDLRVRLSNKAQQYVSANHSKEKIRAQYRLLIEKALERKRMFTPPKLPMHLRSAKQMLKDDLLQTSLKGVDSKIVDHTL